MKVGGVSWNTSTNHKRGVESTAKCQYCGRQYKMGWARDNHEKNCEAHINKKGRSRP